VGALPNLADIEIYHCPIQDAYAGVLGECRGLTRLTLVGTELTDRGLSSVLPLPNLNRLVLAGEGITDSSVPLMLRCPQLSELKLDDTGVSEAEAARLKQQIPRCTIRKFDDQ
jgi:hypothetical protein